MAASPLRRSPLTAATVTPPSLDRQHKFHATDSSKRSSSASSASTTNSSSSTPSSPTMSPTTSTASMVLATVASLAGGARRKSTNNAPSPPASQQPQTQQTSDGPADRRVSWDACRRERDGYVSFPDFDQLRALERERRISSKE